MKLFYVKKVSGQILIALLVNVFLNKFKLGLN